jgi:hypothetical protein
MLTTPGTDGCGLAVLAQAEYGMSPQMQKYMKARAVAMGEEADFGGMVGQVLQPEVPSPKPQSPQG